MAAGDDAASPQPGAHVNVNGVSHYYRTTGQGPPVVALHGGPGMWHDELVPYFGDLANDHQVVFYDQRGNGKSLMNEITGANFTMDHLLSDLEALRAAWGFERLTLLGHSWGGLLAMHYAARHPERVGRLVLIDPAPVTTELLVESYDTLTERFSDRDRIRLDEIYSSDGYQAGDPLLHNEAMRMSEGATFHVAAAREEYLDLIAFDELTARNMVAIGEPGRAILRSVDVRDELANISCPTLVVHGAEDFVSMKAATLVAELISDAQLAVIPESGHYPFIEQPEAFTQALRSFLDESAR